MKLTPHEYELLLQLARSEGRALTYRTLLQKVWDPGYVSDLSLVKHLMYGLRKKLGCSTDCPQLIGGEPGVGYKFTELG